jgi:hypothetical protein
MKSLGIILTILFFSSIKSDVTLTAFTDKSPFNQGGPVKLTFGSSITDSPLSENNNDKYEWTFNDFWYTGYEVPTIEATTGERVGLCTMCPYAFSNCADSNQNNVLLLDSSPKRSWKLKPWGIPTTIAATLRMKVAIGNCDWCGGSQIKVEWSFRSCGPLSEIFDCSLGSSHESTIQANKNSEQSTTIGVVGGAFGFVSRLVYVKLTNTGGGDIGLNSVIVEDILGVNHCEMVSSCSRGDTSGGCVYRLRPNVPFSFPCYTPLYNIDPPLLLGITNSLQSIKGLYESNVLNDQCF